MNHFEFASLTGIFLGALIVIVISGIFRLSSKILLLLTANSIIGGIVMYITNLFSYYNEIPFIITPFKSLFTGITGIPGYLLLLILSLIH